MGGGRRQEAGEVEARPIPGREEGGASSSSGEWGAEGVGEILGGGGDRYW